MPMVYRMNRESKIRNSGQRGMTLVELMVVVAILSVLSAAAVVTINPTLRLKDQANLVAQRIAEAARLAIRNGPGPEEIITNPVFTSDITSRSLFSARSRLLIDKDANDRVFMSVQLREATPGLETDFTETRSSWLSADVHGNVGFQRDSTVNPAGYTYSTTSLPLEILCYPDGRCESATVYLQNTDENEFVRITNLNIQGTPLVFSGW